ncbi:MAG: hypothetical protein RL662_1425 [Bacteroidota bacterium]|jgi:uncharacterized glyoxalase superfamily protein PhnB
MKQISILTLLLLFLGCTNNDNKTIRKSRNEKQFKPTGHNAMAPYVIAENPESLVNFLVNTFDAQELNRYSHTDGSILHIELLIDDSILMLSAANVQQPATKSYIHVYVPNAQETFELAIRNGAEPVVEPVIDEGDTDMRGVFKDFSGNVWAIATHTAQ